MVTEKAILLFSTLLFKLMDIFPVVEAPHFVVETVHNIFELFKMINWFYVPGSLAILLGIALFGGGAKLVWSFIQLILSLIP